MNKHLGSKQFTQYVTRLIIFTVVNLQHSVPVTMEQENTTQIVTTSMIVTERSATPLSSKLSDTAGAEKEDGEKPCSATLCSTLCPESYFKCDAMGTTCVCANSKKASEPHSSCTEIVSKNPEDFPKFADANDLAACQATCTRIALQVFYYGYKIHLYVCEAVNLTATTESTNGQCLCYFLNANVYYSN